MRLPWFLVFTAIVFLFSLVVWQNYIVEIHKARSLAWLHAKEQIENCKALGRDRAIIDLDLHIENRVAVTCERPLVR